MKRRTGVLFWLLALGATPALAEAPAGLRFAERDPVTDGSGQNMLEQRSVSVRATHQHDSPEPALWIFPGEHPPPA